MTKLGLRLITPEIRWSNSCALLKAGSSEWVPPLTGRHAPSTFGWPSTVFAGGQGLAVGCRFSPWPDKEAESNTRSVIVAPCIRMSVMLMRLMPKAQSAMRNAHCHEPRPSTVRLQ